MGLEQIERGRCELDGRVALALQPLRELRDGGVSNVDQGRKTVGGSTAIGTGLERSAFSVRSVASRMVVAIASGSSIDPTDLRVSDVMECEDSVVPSVERRPLVATDRPMTIGALRESGYRSRTVKEELRANLMVALARKTPLFDGIVGYEQTVIPQIENAILSGQDIIFLGERGQAKTRLIRSLTGLLDE